MRNQRLFVVGRLLLCLLILLAVGVGMGELSAVRAAPVDVSDQETEKVLNYLLEKVPEIARMSQKNPTQRMVLSIDQGPAPESENFMERNYYQVYVGFNIEDGGPGHRSRWATFLVDKQLSEILWVNFLTGDSYVPLEDWQQYVFKDRDEEQNDWMCIPFLRAGPIRSYSSLNDIVRMFGREKVTRRTVYGPEAIESFEATIVYPETPDELIVFWQANKYGSAVSRVSIRKENSRWRTLYGIKLGTEIARLNEINQRPFFFYGFGWDYGGMIRMDWNGGRLASTNGMAMVLKESRQLDLAYYGDKELRSDSAGLLPDGARVGRIEIQLSTQ